MLFVVWSATSLAQPLATCCLPVQKLPQPSVLLARSFAHSLTALWPVGALAAWWWVGDAAPAVTSVVATVLNACTCLQRVVSARSRGPCQCEAHHASN